MNSKPQNTSGPKRSKKRVCELGSSCASHTIWPLFSLKTALWGKDYPLFQGRKMRLRKWFTQYHTAVKQEEGETRTHSHLPIAPENMFLTNALGNDASGGLVHSRSPIQRSYRCYKWRPGRKARQISACLRVGPTSWERADSKGTKSQGA